MFIPRYNNVCVELDLHFQVDSYKPGCSSKRCNTIYSFISTCCCSVFVSILPHSRLHYDTTLRPVLPAVQGFPPRCLTQQPLRRHTMAAFELQISVA